MICLLCQIYNTREPNSVISGRNNNTLRRNGLYNVSRIQDKTK